MARVSTIAPLQPRQRPIRKQLYPQLPQDDAKEIQRRRFLKENQERYRYNYSYITSIAMLDGLPTEEYPSTTWGFLAGKQVLQALWNQILIREGTVYQRWKHWNAYSLLENLEWAGLNLRMLLDRNYDPKNLRGLADQRNRYFDFRSDVRAWETENAHGTDDLISRLSELKSEFVFDVPAGKAKSLTDFNELFQNIQIPEEYRFFRKDSYFAFLRVAGPNPMVIERAVPGWDTSFLVSDECFRTVPGFQDDTLKAALDGNRLYIADYQILGQIELGTSPRGQKYLSAPKALFAVSERVELKGQLFPIAIQCEQIPNSKSNPVFYPKDGYAWEMAKTVVQVADGNHHELISHLSLTHLLLEAFMIATRRQLAPTHPLSILLNPHFEGLAFINWAAQKFLLVENGPLDHLLAGTIESSKTLAISILKNVSFNQLIPSSLFKLRNVDDPILDFPYRDDSNRLWGAIHDWVKGYLELYYTSAADITNDIELKRWSNEIVSPMGGRISGFGEDGRGKISSFRYLTDAVALLIFTSSVQHAAVNFPQYTAMSYTPAVPLAAYSKNPTKKKYRQKDWLNQFPPLDMAREQLAVLFTLGSVYYGELGAYGSRYFQDDRVIPILKSFQDRLEEIGTDIRLRNSARVKEGLQPYTTLLPSKIPTSINI